MSEKVVVSRSKLVSVADAIRAKTETSGALTLEDMPTAIEGIQGGGGVVIDFSKNLNVAEEIVADVYLEKGKEVAYQGWSTTGFIKTTQGSYYAVKSSSQIQGKYSAFYNENKSFKKVISGNFITPSDSNSFLLLECQGDYVRFSASTSVINALKIHECSG